jgi:hypothetical protein
MMIGDVGRMHPDTTDIDGSLIDQLMVVCAHRDWCRASYDATAAYARFSTSVIADRNLTFAAYLAALDREEAAARSYARRAGSVTSVLLDRTPPLGR